MITSIRLQNFRSYKDASFTFDPGVSIIVGPNASGKTNLLEAVLMVARGGSYRAKDAEMVGFGADWARLDAESPTDARTVKIQATPAADSFKKTFEIDGQTLQRLLQPRMIPAVVFEPNHLLLLNGSPDLRRSFLDDLIEQTKPGFGAARRHYKRVLAQRNALLKKNPPSLREQLFVWNLRLSEFAGQIARERAELIAHCNNRASELYDSLAGKNNVITLEYASKFSPEHYESQLLQKLEQRLDLDIARGYTGYGPHRDDLVALIDGHPVQEAASRGETRTLVLALKIMELQLLESVRDVKPLLLLDDVFSELDTQRRQALTHFVQPYQTFITTTDADVVADYFATSHSIISLTT
jgi:DNA replication and repair protein RecF